MSAPKMDARSAARRRRTMRVANVPMRLVLSLPLPTNSWPIRPRSALLVRMATLNPALIRFVPLPRAADGTFGAEPLRAAISHGFRIVRWHDMAESTSRREVRRWSGSS